MLTDTLGILYDTLNNIKSFDYSTAQLGHLIKGYSTLYHFPPKNNVGSDTPLFDRKESFRRFRTAARELTERLVNSNKFSLEEKTEYAGYVLDSCLDFSDMDILDPVLSETCSILATSRRNQSPLSAHLCKLLCLAHYYLPEEGYDTYAGEIMGTWIENLDTDGFWNTLSFSEAYGRINAMGIFCNAVCKETVLPYLQKTTEHYLPKETDLPENTDDMAMLADITDIIVNTGNYETYKYFSEKLIGHISEIYHTENGHNSPGSNLLVIANYIRMKQYLAPLR